MQSNILWPPPLKWMALSHATKGTIVNQHLMFGVLKNLWTYCLPTNNVY